MPLRGFYRMNTPPHSESGPSCSNSVSSLKDLSTMATTKLIAHPPTPPFDSREVITPVQPQFFLDPCQFEDRPHQHECCTVLEEDEDENGSIESSAAVSVSIGSSSDYGGSIAPPARTSTEKSNEKSPSMKRRTSSRLTSFFKRSSPPNGTVEPTEQATPALPNGLRSTRSFFTSRSQRAPSFNGVPSRLETGVPSEGSSSQSELDNVDATLGPRTGTSETFGHFTGRLSRNRRSASMTGIANLTASNQITHPAPTGLGLKSRKISDVGPLPEVQAFPLGSKYTTHGAVPMRSNKIGEGATAIVKLYREISKDGDSGVVFAVKEFRKKSSTEKEDEYVFKVKSEFLVSKSLHHPNIVETADLCIGSGKRWCHVMEYCPGGDLFSLIKKGYMKDSERLCCFKQLLRGVAYLHKQGIAHRDIKPENLLMSNDGHLKITDFGVSERFIAKDHIQSDGQFDIKDLIRSSPGICGSEPYLPPEVLAKKGNCPLMLFDNVINFFLGTYDARKLDVWSCAIVYFTLNYGGTAWGHAKDDDANYQKYVQSWKKWEVKHPDMTITNDCDLPSFRGYCEFKTGIKRLLYRMTHLDPEKRITIHEALDDRHIQGIECCTFDDEYSCKEKLDASHTTACRTANKMNVKRMHAHLPPKHI